MTTLLSAPALRMTAGPAAGRVYEIGESLRIGRHPYNDVSIGDPSVSRYHCWVMLHGVGFVVEDLGSTNGTFVNGEKVQGRRIIRAGDRVRVGTVEFNFGD